MSEKLAAIGEITAGVAHEINNPIAVIQGNLEVLRMLLGEQAEVASTEIRLIDEQVGRINQIVMKLLQFAKPDEYAGSIDRHAPDEVISDCMPLVRHLLRKSEIEVLREPQATRTILMNRTELQQVLINLIVNAVHAMPEGGELTLKTRDEDRITGRGDCRDQRYRHRHDPGGRFSDLRSVLHDQKPPGHRSGAVDYPNPGHASGRGHPRRQ